MIHQFIFAHPRPGMSEEDFQDYWLNVHAVKYARYIPQIRRYLIDTRIPLPGETGDPLWSGVAEIWLANEEEQIASLQTPEFLQGARLDEPNWAAFWRTVVMDTTAHEIMTGLPKGHDRPKTKLLVLIKRKEGLRLRDFHSYCLGTHSAKATVLPGLSRYQQGHLRNGFYALGEAMLDCVEQFWFENLDAALAAEASLEQKFLDADYGLFTEERYIHKLLVEEHWIIGPEPRPYPPATFPGNA